MPIYDMVEDSIRLTGRTLQRDVGVAWLRGEMFEFVNLSIRG